MAVFKVSRGSTGEKLYKSKKTLRCESMLLRRDYAVSRDRDRGEVDYRDVSLFKNEAHLNLVEYKGGMRT